MTRHTWGRIAVLGLVVLVASAASNAAVVFENGWNADTADAGGFSQPEQILAGSFSLADAASVDRATWYGTMYSGDPLNTGDTWNFDVVFWTESGGLPGTAFGTSSVVASVTDTGLSIGDERAYLFDASFADVALAGGTPYFMSVVNTGTANTFRWNLGQDAAYPSHFTNDGGVNWSHDSYRPTVNFTLYGEAGGPTVPVPGALFLAGLGTGMATWLRRRRAL